MPCSQLGLSFPLCDISTVFFQSQMSNLSPCMLWAWVLDLSCIISLPLVFILKEEPPASTSQAIVITGLNHQVWSKNFLPATLWLAVGMENAECNTNAFQSDSVRTRDPKLWSKLAEKKKKKNIANLLERVWQNSTQISWFRSMFEEQFYIFLQAQKNVPCGKFQESHWALDSASFISSWQRGLRQSDKKKKKKKKSPNLSQLWKRESLEPWPHTPGKQHGAY